jgi:hypothetical protein
MKYVKTYESFLNEGKDHLTLFRGQTGEFFDDNKKAGYQKMYGMLFLSDDINNAYFYTKPGQQEIREITVFEVPGNIAKVQGVYIDRLGTDKIEQFKKEGYDGVTSNVGELMADKGEVGMFQNYTPSRRFQTNNGKFSAKDIKELKKLGLADYYIKQEENL